MAVDLRAAFAAVEAPWTPLIVGALNGQHVKVARLEGSFVWHHHADADELFLVIEGCLTMRTATATTRCSSRGSSPSCRGGGAPSEALEGPVQVVLFEPAGTVTGSAGGDRTVDPERWG